MNRFTNPPPSSNGRPAGATPLRDLLHFALRNRLLVFGTPLLVVAATTVFVLLATPIYDATTWIRIDEERSNLPVLDALTTLSAGSQLHTEMQVLRRRPLAEEVVDSLGLQLVVGRPRRVPRGELFDRIDIDRTAPEAAYRLRRVGEGRFAVTREDDGVSFGEAAPGRPVALDGATLTLAPAAAAHAEIHLVVLDFQRAVRAFRETVEVSRPDREADIVVIRFQGPDPDLVRRVTDTMARLFIERRQEVRKTEARSTVRFLRDQIDTLSVQLVDAEDRLRTFREAEKIVSLEAEGEAQVGRLVQLRAERDLLDSEREALANLLDEVRATPAAPGDASPYRRLIYFPSLLRNFAVSELFRSMAEVENQRAALLIRRTLEDPEVQVLSNRILELEEQLRHIAVTYLDGLTNQLASIDETLNRFRDELSAIPAREVQFARLSRHAEVLDEIYTLLQTRLKETEVVAAVEDPSVRIVEPALLPVDPIKPNKKLSLVLALVLGVGLGVGVAFLRENMDGTLHTREDLQSTTGGAPVLGLVPRIQDAVDGAGWLRARRPEQASAVGAALSARLVAGRNPRSPISEAYRSLRTNIAFSSLERPPKTLVFTSALPGDGKSTSAANLAITLAQQGIRSLLIDADMRRGVLHEVFGAPREPGLSNVLVGEAAVEDVVQRLDLGESGSLDFLPTGTLPPNPAELLGSTRMRELVERLEARYEVVILDAPPLNLVTDAALLGTNADAVILVARAGVTERGAVAYAYEQLMAVRAPLLGTVLNDIDARKDRYYGSYGLAAYEYYAAAEAR